MKKLVLATALVLSTVVVPNPVLSVGSLSETSIGIAQNRIAQDAFARTYLVSLVDGFSDFQLLMQEYSLDIDGELPASINGFSVELNYDQYVAVKQDARVAFVELNEVFESPLTKSSKTPMDGVLHGGLIALIKQLFLLMIGTRICSRARG